MSEVMWWTGAIIWCMTAIILLYLVYEFLRAFVACVSWYHWAILEVKRLGRDVPYWGMMKTFFKTWAELIGHRPGSQKWTTHNGAQWRAIGDWNLGTLLPPQPEAS